MMIFDVNKFAGVTADVNVFGVINFTWPHVTGSAAGCTASFKPSGWRGCEEIVFISMAR